MITRDSAEKQLLYRFLLGPAAHLQPALAAGLAAADFADERNRAIFTGLALMWNRQVASFTPPPGRTRALATAFDILELERILKESGTFWKAGGRDFLYAIPCTTTDSSVTTEELIGRLKGTVTA